MTVDKRSELRQRVFLRGKILFNNGASSIDCLVRDISRVGARLALSETTSLPEVFDIHVAQKDHTYRARLRWRREDGAGVTFLDQEAAKPPVNETGDASVAVLLRRITELETENASLRRLLAEIAGGRDGTA